MAKKQRSNSTTAGILFISGMVLMALKFTGYISWPWWIVLIPLYPMMLSMSLGIAMLVLAVVSIVALKFMK